MKSSGLNHYALSFCLAAVMLAACGGSQPPIGAPGAMPQGLAVAHAGQGTSSVAPLQTSHLYAEPNSHPLINAFDRGSWISRDANPNHPWLYVASYSNNKIDIYDVQKLALKKIGQIADEIDQPAGISIDGKGSLYVSEQVGKVEIYAAGSTSPTLTLSQGLTYANDAVTDAAGNVYVANSGGSIADIVVYPPGQTTPSETITSALFSRPYGEAFDSSGDLYVADWYLGVCMIAAGSQQVESLGLTGGGQPAGIAFDATTDNLFVNYYYGPGKYTTLVYAAGSANPIRALRGTEGANEMTIGKIGHSSYLFVPGFFSSKIYAYKPNARKPSAVMLTDAKNISGVAFKPAGVL